MNTGALNGYFRDMFGYERWANERMLVYLGNPPENERLLKIFGHLIAEMVPWLCLLKGKDVPILFDCSPSWTVTECGIRFDTLQSETEDFVASLPEDGLTGVVYSPGAGGKMIENTISEILTHLLSHGQHHRGQMEMIIQNETGQYFPTSYMPYLRQKRS